MNNDKPHQDTQFVLHITYETCYNEKVYSKIAFKQKFISNTMYDHNFAKYSTVRVFYCVSVYKIVNYRKCMVRMTILIWLLFVSYKQTNPMWFINRRNYFNLAISFFVYMLYYIAIYSNCIGKTNETPLLESFGFLTLVEIFVQAVTFKCLLFPHVPKCFPQKAVVFHQWYKDSLNNWEMLKVSDFKKFKNFHISKRILFSFVVDYDS